MLLIVVIMTIQKTIAGLIFVVLFCFIQFEQTVRNEHVRNDIYLTGKSVQFAQIIMEAAGNQNVHPAQLNVTTVSLHIKRPKIMLSA